MNDPTPDTEAGQPAPDGSSDATATDARTPRHREKDVFKQKLAGSAHKELSRRRRMVLKEIDHLNTIHARLIHAGEVEAGDGAVERPGLVRAQLELECLNELIGDI